MPNLAHAAGVLVGSQMLQDMFQASTDTDPPIAVRVPESGGMSGLSRPLSAAGGLAGSLSEEDPETPPRPDLPVPAQGWEWRTDQEGESYLVDIETGDVWDGGGLPSPTGDDAPPSLPAPPSPPPLEEPEPDPETEPPPAQKLSGSPRSKQTRSRRRRKQTPSKAGTHPTLSPLPPQQVVDGAHDLYKIEIQTRSEKEGGRGTVDTSELKEKGVVNLIGPFEILFYDAESEGYKLLGQGIVKLRDEDGAWKLDISNEVIVTAPEPRGQVLDWLLADSADGPWEIRGMRTILGGENIAVLGRIAKSIIEQGERRAVKIVGGGNMKKKRKSKKRKSKKRKSKKRRSKKKKRTYRKRF